MGNHSRKLRLLGGLLVTKLFDLIPISQQVQTAPPARMTQLTVPTIRN